MLRTLVLTLLIFAMAGCVPTPAAVRKNANTPKVVVTTALSMDDAYRTVQSNLVRCFGNAAYIIAAAPSSPDRPPQIVVNGALGHLFAVIDFAPKGPETEVTVNVGYALARASRTEGWQKSMDGWLSGTDRDFCAWMP